MYKKKHKQNFHHEHCMLHCVKSWNLFFIKYLFMIFFTFLPHCCLFFYRHWYFFWCIKYTIIHHIPLRNLFVWTFDFLLNTLWSVRKTCNTLIFFYVTAHPDLFFYLVQRKKNFKGRSTHQIVRLYLHTFEKKNIKHITVWFKCIWSRHFHESHIFGGLKKTIVHFSFNFFFVLSSDSYSTGEKIKSPGMVAGN